MLELSRAEIASLITRGHLLVLHGERVYRLNAWSAKHPGGVFAILHFVGRDASDELEAYHDEAIQATFERFQVARVKSEELVDGWNPLWPPLEAHVGWENLPFDIWGQTECWHDGLRAIGLSKPIDKEKTVKAQLPPVSVEQLEPPPSPVDQKQQHEMSLAYKELHKQVIDAGLYNATPLANYRYELLRYTFFFVAAMAFYFKGTQSCALFSTCLESLHPECDRLTNSTGHFFASAVFLGLWKHQITFVVHDAGHRGVFGTFWKDRVLACAIASFCGGLSALWWCDVRLFHLWQDSKLNSQTEPQYSSQCVD